MSAFQGAVRNGHVPVGSGAITHFYHGLPISGGEPGTQFVVIGAGPVDHYSQGLPFNALGELCCENAPVARYSSGLPYTASGALAYGEEDPPARFSNGTPFTSDGKLNFGGGTFQWDPSRLFSSGQAGVWYDPSDHTTLFSDRVGSVPAVPGSRVMVMLDKSRGLANGPELFPDPNATDLAYWPVEGAPTTREIVPGEGLHIIGGNNAGVNINISAYISLPVVRVVDIELKVLLVSGFIKIQFSYSFGPATPQVGVETTIRMRVPLAAANYLVLTGGQGEFYIRGLSIKEVEGTHLYNTVSTDSPTLREVNSNSYLEFDGLTATGGMTAAIVGAANYLVQPTSFFSMNDFKRNTGNTDPALWGGENTNRNQVWAGTSKIQFFAGTQVAPAENLALPWPLGCYQMKFNDISSKAVFDNNVTQAVVGSPGAMSVEQTLFLGRFSATGNAACMDFYGAVVRATPDLTADEVTNIVDYLRAKAGTGGYGF